MRASVRRQRVADIARFRGHVDIHVLAKEFDVTADTVRRDLHTLERDGVVRRVRGGAVPVQRAYPAGAICLPMDVEKDRIARRALDELPIAGTILLDSGSITARIAQLLPVDRLFTVVTNAIDIAAALVGRPNISLVILGGSVRARSFAALADWGNDLARDAFVDVAFVGASSVSATHGLMSQDPSESTVKRAMMSAARRVVIVADHTKFHRAGVTRFASLADADLVITDSGLEPGIAAPVCAVTSLVLC